MTDHSPYTVPQEPGRWRAITLAAAVHVALLVFFWIGIDWQSQTPVAVQAEIWDLQAKEAAPLPPEPTPVPQPKPEPKPEPKPVKETPKAEPVEPPPVKVDIALEKEKKRKEQERKDKLAEEKEKQEKLKEQQAEKKKADDKKQAELDQKKKADDKKQTELDQKKKQQEAADEKRRADLRAEEMRRLTGAVGSGGNGDAPKSQGLGRGDPGYADKIRAKIRSNTIFNVQDGISGNPAVEYDVELLPDGSLRGEPRLRKSSNLSGFDEAVKRAIERSQPFPPDKSGSAPSRLTIVHKPKDQ